MASSAHSVAWAGGSVVPDPLALTTTQAFELERLSRAIDATHDPAVLQSLCKQLLQAWQTQKAATAWAMRQGLRPAPLACAKPSPGADAHPSV